MNYGFVMTAPAFATINIDDPDNPTLDIEILYANDLEGV